MLDANLSPVCYDDALVYRFYFISSNAPIIYSYFIFTNDTRFHSEYIAKFSMCEFIILSSQTIIDFYVLHCLWLSIIHQRIKIRVIIVVASVVL